MIIKICELMWKKWKKKKTIINIIIIVPAFAWIETNS